MERQPNYSKTDHSQLKERGIMRLFKYFALKPDTVEITIEEVPVKKDNAGRYF